MVDSSSPVVVLDDGLAVVVGDSVSEELVVVEPVVLDSDSVVGLLVVVVVVVVVVLGLGFLVVLVLDLVLYPRPP